MRRRITGDYSIDDFGFDEEFTREIWLPLLRPLYKRWFRVEVRGIENIPATGRALVVAINKWDSAEDQSRLFNGIKQALEDGLAQVRGVPVLTVSALTGKGLDVLMNVAFETRERWSRRVPTAALNRWFEAAQDRNPPPPAGGRRIKMRYITQARSRPPTFIVFGTRLDELPDSYNRYLVNSLRDDLDLKGLPIRINMRSSRNPFDT